MVGRQNHSQRSDLSKRTDKQHQREHQKSEFSYVNNQSHTVIHRDSADKSHNTSLRLFKTIRRKKHAIGWSDRRIHHETILKDLYETRTLGRDNRIDMRNRRIIQRKAIPS
jgi:hypothetical protein